MLPAAAALRDALASGAVSEDEFQAYVPEVYQREPGLFHEGGIASSPSISEDLRQMATIVEDGGTGEGNFFRAHVAIWARGFCDTFSTGVGPPEVKAYYQAECLQFVEFIDVLSTLHLATPT
jgi:hypothetical protein